MHGSCLWDAVEFDAASGALGDAGRASFVDDAGLAAGHLGVDASERAAPSIGLDHVVD